MSDQFTQSLTNLNPAVDAMDSLAPSPVASDAPIGKISQSLPSKLSPYLFYVEMTGHSIAQLDTLLQLAAAMPTTLPRIFLAGDGSLDNKYWITNKQGRNLSLPSFYKQIMGHGTVKPDVAFWMNQYLDGRAITINTAVAATTISDRPRLNRAGAHALLQQDMLIRDSISEEDILIVSLGGNDIGLRPSMTTLWHLIRLVYFSSQSALADGTAWCLDYFVKLFGDQLHSYISELISQKKPKAVVVCMIYYPLEAGNGQGGWAEAGDDQGGWAEAPLDMMGYNKNPQRLQAAIRTIYELAIKGMKIEGTQVIPCPLFEVLDSKNRDDYVDRVQPSAVGGQKMAVKFAELLEDILPTPNF